MLSLYIEQLIFILAATVISTSAERPNIIILLADDLGYGDLASYGHPGQESTPIDQMSNEGTRFTQFYSADSICTPARAGLMTGRYPIRSGMTGGTRISTPVDTGGLPHEEITLAEMMKSAGYVTGMTGKWHLGLNRKTSSDGYYLPHNHGFDYVGITIPITNFWACDESKQLQKSGPIKLMCFLYNNTELYQQPIAHRDLTMLHLDDFQYFISQHRSKPFFFYYSFPQVHVSLFSWQTKFANSSKRGLLGGDIMEMGYAVGEVFRLLKQNKVDKNTLVIFTSDHGPRIEMCLYGGVTNGLKGGKTSSYEGGFRVPFILWGPNYLNSNKKVNNGVFNTLDLFPTLANIVGGDIPTDRIIDGIDRGDEFLGFSESQELFKPIFYYCNRHLMALRYGNYKAHFYTVPIFNTRKDSPALCPNGIPTMNMHFSKNCPYEDLEVQEPPLLFNIEFDPRELFPLVPETHEEIMKTMKYVAQMHNATVDQSIANQLGNYNPVVVPCCNPPTCICNYQPPSDDLLQNIPIP